MKRNILEKIHDRVFYKLRTLHIKTREKHILKKGNMKFSHVTLYSVRNAGDTALSQCVRKTFEFKFNTINWNLKSVFAPVNKNTVKNMNRTDAIIIGGGGLFLPDTNFNTISGWEWACSESDMKKISVPLIVYSVGYNYFYGQVPNSLFINSLNSIVEKSSFFGLRNNGSIKKVRELINPKLQKKVCFQPCTTTLIRKIYKDLPPKTQSKCIAVNVAFDRADMRFGGDKKEVILSQIARAMKKIESE